MASKEILAADAPKPIGPYSQAVLSGRFVFCSGQIGVDPRRGELVGPAAAAQAERAIDNLEAVLRAAGTDLSHVVKVTLYLVDMRDFAEVNSVYSRRFGSTRPSRSTVQISALPKGACVEIDAIASL